MRSILILSLITIIPFLSFELQLPGTATSGVVLTAFASTNVTGENETVTLTITRNVTSGPIPIIKLSKPNRRSKQNESDASWINNGNYTNDTVFVFNLTSSPFKLNSPNQTNRTNP